MKVNGELSLLFELLRGILQGDTIAPYLFIIVADYILRRALARHPEVAFVLEGNTTGPRTRSRAQREQGNGLRETGGLYADDLFVMSGVYGRLDGYVQSLTEILRVNNVKKIALALRKIRGGIYAKICEDRKIKIKICKQA